MPAKTVALIAAVALTIGWLLAATLTPPVARSQSVPPRQPRPAPSSENAPMTEQLHLRLRDLPEPPLARRNPFAFGARERSSAPRATREPRHVEEIPADVPPPAWPPRPAFILSGIGITGAVRTAILTDGSNVRIVGVNEAIGPYTVVEITESTVTLESPTDRQILRLPH